MVYNHYTNHIESVPIRLTMHKKKVSNLIDYMYSNVIVKQHKYKKEKDGKKKKETSFKGLNILKDYIKLDIELLGCVKKSL